MAGKRDGRDGIGRRGAGTRAAVTAALCALATAAALSGGGAPPASGAGSDPAASPAASAAATSARPVAPARTTRSVRTTVVLPLAGARIVRTAAGPRLRGRPTGTARLSRRRADGGRLRVPARVFARVLDGLADHARIPARLAGRPLTLRTPTLRGGVVTAALRGGRAARAGRLGRVTLRLRIDDRDVPRRGRCTLLPFASCAGAQLTFADLPYSDVRGIDLRNAVLHRAYAHGARLGGADLRGADLRGADLTDADLRGADLRGANLADASLRFARLARADLRGAHLCGALLPRGRRPTRRTCERPQPTGRALGRRAWRLPPALAPASGRRGRGTRGRGRGRGPAARSTPGARASVLGRAAQGGLTPLAPEPPTPNPPVRAPDGCVGNSIGLGYSNTKDGDEDGLTDCFEVTERTVAGILSADDLNAGRGPHDVGGVTTDRRRADSDGDGLNDGQELLLRTNPKAADSDDDGLGDRAEVATYLSNPLDGDSDDDAVVSGSNRDPNLYDGAEARQGSSPIDTDTDGDGFSDTDETRHGGVQNPVVANLPTFSLTVDRSKSVSVSIETTVTTGDRRTQSAESASMRSSEATESHELSVEIGTEFSQEFESKTKVGEPENEQSFTASFGFQQSISTGTTNSWENTQTAEQESRTVQELETSRETEVGPGTCVTATMLLRNTSTVGFKLSNLAIIATTPDPDDPTRSLTMATMQPVSGEPKAPGECPGTQQGATVELDTNTTATPITFAGPATKEVVEEFYADPKPITFELSNSEIDEPSGESYARIKQDVDDKDVAVIVDYGSHAPAGSPRIHEYMVAAAARKTRVAGGAPVAAGLSADEALRRLGLRPLYGGGASGRANLIGLGGVRNAEDSNDGTWTVVGSGIGVADDRVDFPDILLRPGDPATTFPGDHGTIVLTYLDDSDDDGVPSNLEAVNGTDPKTVDTDGDGLSDRFETKGGWTVPLPRGGRGDYHVFSSPLTCDSDGDRSPDGPGRGNDRFGLCPQHAPEYNRGSAGSGGLSRLLVPRGPDGDDGLVGTDPKLADTNEDGRTDWPEPYPEVLDHVDPSKRAPVPVRQYGGAGRAGGGQFNLASALAVDHGGGRQVYVATPADHGISVFDPTLGADNPFVGQIAFDDHGFSAVAVSQVRIAGGKGVAPTAGNRGFAAWTEDAMPFGYRSRARAFNSVTRQRSGDSFAIADDSLRPLQLHIATGAGPAGNLYVATNAGSDKLDEMVAGASISEYTASGKRVRTFGSKPSRRNGKWVFGSADERVNPTGIAVDRDGDLFVSEAAYPYSWGVRKYDGKSGKLVASYRTQQLRHPLGIAVDGNGYVYVAAGKADGNPGNVVYKLSNSLTYLTAFGGAGGGRGLFNGPLDLDSGIGWGNAPCSGEERADDSGTVAVLDAGNHLVQEFAYPLGEGGPDPGLGCG